MQAITAGAILIGAFAGPWVWLAVSRGTLAVLPANPLGYLVSLLNASSVIYAVLAIGAVIARLR